MAYRKIEVNGVTYEYTIGRTHVKVRGVGTALKEDIGRSTVITGYDDNDDPVEHRIDPNRIAILPGDVARWIKGMVG